MYLHVSVDVAAERVFECAASGHGGIAKRVGADEEHQSVLRQEATAAPDQGASTSSWMNFEVNKYITEVVRFRRNCSSSTRLRTQSAWTATCASSDRNSTAR